MFACPYADRDEEDAQVECTPPHQAGGVGHVLVPDSDNDDSLGLPVSPVPSSSGCVPAVRAFSKRAARCAAALLQRHDTATSVVHKRRCVQQLGRLGGTYRSLAHGQTLTVWTHHQDLNIRAIHETDAFFEGHMEDHLAHPHVTRKNRVLRAARKAAFGSSPQRHSPAASFGCRASLPSSLPPTHAARATSHSDSAVGADVAPLQTGYRLSRAEQCALSLLFMDDAADAKYTSSPLQTFGAHHTSDDGSQHMDLSESLCDALSHGSCPADTHATMSLWVYGEDSDSLHSSPSPAAHYGDSPSAVPQHRKRDRGDTTWTGLQPLKGRRGAVCATRILGFDELSMSSSSQSAIPLEEKSVARRDTPVPASLSATVIELQNQRVQWNLLRQQSLFGPF
nr:unnamed protein product [Leishmania braziliensis]